MDGGHENVEVDGMMVVTASATATDAERQVEVFN